MMPEIPSHRHIENGFPVEYEVDLDGDRYVIIDPDDADMSGWRVEVGPDEARYRQGGLTVRGEHYVREFTGDTSGIEAA
jgi:hypothetical protein